jgi:hypothetical protein
MENEMRIAIALVLAFAASRALADEVEDAHRQAPDALYLWRR